MYSVLSLGLKKNSEVHTQIYSFYAENISEGKQKKLALMVALGLGDMGNRAVRMGYALLFH